ncbi:MAG: hypothetical protein M1822_000608 [Bathelium mastoideum]|nr:MAG: hypothetical protein M1822_000608 [Bathelium mastoideum]
MDDPRNTSRTGRLKRAVETSAAMLLLICQPSSKMHKSSKSVTSEVNEKLSKIPPFRTKKDEADEDDEPRLASIFPRMSKYEKGKEKMIEVPDIEISENELPATLDIDLHAKFRIPIGQQLFQSLQSDSNAGPSTSNDSDSPSLAHQAASRKLLNALVSQIQIIGAELHLLALEEGRQQTKLGNIAPTVTTGTVSFQSKDEAQVATYPYTGKTSVAITTDISCIARGSGPFRFMQLPNQVRQQIYPLLISFGDIHIAPSADRQESEHSNDADHADTAILLVCRQIYREALPIYLAHKRWVFASDSTAVEAVQQLTALRSYSPDAAHRALSTSHHVARLPRPLPFLATAAQPALPALNISFAVHTPPPPGADTLLHETRAAATTSDAASAALHASPLYHYARWAQQQANRPGAATAAPTTTRQSVHAFLLAEAERALGGVLARLLPLLVVVGAVGNKEYDEDDDEVRVTVRLAHRWCVLAGCPRHVCGAHVTLVRSFGRRAPGGLRPIGSDGGRRKVRFVGVAGLEEERALMRWADDSPHVWVEDCSFEWGVLQ